MSTRQVGQYEIIRELGRGGMAVVYKAWQPSLERHVALKVLPEYFQHDPEFLARFQREARAAAQLNHPNILYIYDVGEQDGVHYIAMEYLEGGSLRDRLATGPLSMDEIQTVLAQVAAGLDYAHARGLIHRDIKPDNILFADDGRPKVADFGIARPTHETGLTRTGVLMGTPAFMAPEQSEGKTIDHRVDLYALGVVVYQMLTGRMPFRRTTPHAVLHAVIYESPTPPRQVKPGLDPAVDSVVLKALSKNPEQRFQTAKALAQALQRERAGEAVPVPDRAGRPPKREPSSKPTARYVAVAAGVVAILLLALVGFWVLPSTGSVTPTDIASAPDGGTGTAVALLHQAQTATAAAAAGRSTEGALRATEQSLLATARMLDDRSATGTAEAIRQAQLSATAEAAQRQATETAIVAAERDVTVRQTANAMATEAAWEATLTAEARPPDTPTPVPVPPTPVLVPPTPVPVPKPSSRIAFASERDGNSEVYVMGADGSGLVNLTRNPAFDLRPRWSPDGRRILFVSERSGNRDVFVMNADGSGQVNLTNHPAGDDRPWSSPDGRRIVFESNRTGDWEIHLMNADGSGQANLTSNTATDLQPSWSPAGRGIVFYFNRDGNPELYVMNTDGSGQTRLPGYEKDEFTPAWSPNGRRIAFVSERDGNFEIYTMMADGSEVTRLTNHPASHGDPLWWGP